MIFEGDPRPVWLSLLLAAIVSLLVVAALARAKRRATVAWVALSALALLLIGSAAGAGLSVQPQWRSQQDTALTLVAVGVPGGLLALRGAALVVRASWPRGLRTAAGVCLGALVGLFATLFALASRPAWLTTEEPAPGVPGPSHTVGETLWDVAWLGTAGAAFALAIVLLIVVAMSRSFGRAPEREEGADSVAFT